MTDTITARKNSIKKTRDAYMSHLSLRVAKRMQFHPKVNYVLQEEFGDAILVHTPTQVNRVTFNWNRQVGYVDIVYGYNRQASARTYRALTVTDETTFADIVTNVIVEATATH